MNYYGVVALVTIIGVSSSGCTPTYMTRAVRDSLQTEDLGQIQYSLGEQVVLRREMKTNERNVTPGHQVKVINGKRIEEIVFPKGSKGIAVESPHNSDLLLISFESGTSEYPNPALPFSADKEGNTNFVLQSGQMVGYQGNPFMACVGTLNAGDVVGLMLLQGIQCINSRKAPLIIDFKQVSKSTRDRRVVPGRLVGQ